jgi:hypothetical protein
MATFDGFAPNDMPKNVEGNVNGTHRRPFGLRFRMATRC